MLGTVPGRRAVVPYYPPQRDTRALKKPRLQTHPLDGSSLAMSGDYRTMHFTQGRTSQEPPHLGSSQGYYQYNYQMETPEVLREVEVPQSVGPRTQSQRFCMACGNLPTDGQVLLVCASRGCENAVDLNCFTSFQNLGTYDSRCWWCPLHSEAEALVEDGDDDFDEDNDDEFFDEKRGQQGGKPFHRGGTSFRTGRGTGATDAPPPSQYGLSSGPSEASVSVGCTIDQGQLMKKSLSLSTLPHTTHPLSSPFSGNFRFFRYWAC